MKAITIKGTTPAGIEAALAESTKDGFKPTLAIITLTKVENTEAIQAIFDRNGIAIFGLSTSQKFTEQGLESDDIAVMLMDMNPAYFSIMLNDYKDSSAYEAGHRAGLAGKNLFANPGFIISPIDFGVSGDKLIRGITDAADEEVSIMGGVAGNLYDGLGLVFTNASSSSSGLLSLIIDRDKILINGFAVSGWKPVGTTKTITKVEGLWVFTIDHEPAMNVIQRFLGNEMIVSADSTNGLLPTELGYPLQFERASGHVIMRPALFFNPTNQSVMLAGEVKEGDRFRFSLPPDFDVIEKVVESARTVKEMEMPDADAMLVFSCVGRLGSFGPLIDTEIEGLASIWNKPMLGFFSLGEFGKLDEGRCEWHGTTVSWVALKEK
ncbi:MAG: FIST C-terminal domain-containing protein [Algoriphagus sp.]|uniref:FIST signal transduction protein n=1 Tax=Algoriphagus sp. TaxID=1872435 RepID=UPI0018166E58|nr:FIST C-terminal domain-containing protein [Algoriphagus sp.]NVJ87629.1 FIST C-terminal domain-containing protein [Algoriphagus sp.]